MTDSKYASTDIGTAATTAILLAGGRGSRLGGVDKGWIEWRQRPLIEQVLERLRPQVAQIIITCNRNLELYQSLGVRCITDNDAMGGESVFAGPIAGIAAAGLHITTARVLLCPCDTPLIPVDLALRLHQAMDAGPCEVAIPRQSGRLHYSHALLAATFAATAPLFLQRGSRALYRWFEQTSQCVVEFPADDSFRNMNTPADLT